MLSYEFDAGERQPSGSRVVSACAYWNFEHRGEKMRFLADEFGAAGEIWEQGDLYWASYYDVVDDGGRPVGCWPKINRPFGSVKDAVDAIAAKFRAEMICG
jgi:hypothetical protein